MKDYLVKLMWKGRSFSITISASNSTDVYAIVRAQYPGCTISSVSEVR